MYSKPNLGVLWSLVLAFKFVNPDSDVSLDGRIQNFLTYNYVLYMYNYSYVYSVVNIYIYVCVVPVHAMHTAAIHTYNTCMLC